MPLALLLALFGIQGATTLAALTAPEWIQIATELLQLAPGAQKLVISLHPVFEQIISSGDAALASGIVSKWLAENGDATIKEYPFTACA